MGLMQKMCKCGHPRAAHDMWGNGPCEDCAREWVVHPCLEFIDIEETGVDFTSVPQGKLPN